MLAHSYLVVRILVVEADEGFGLLLAEALRGAGWEPELMRSVGECLRAKPGAVDAVVVDERLPDADGVSLVSDIRRKTNAPVIVLTGGTTESAVRSLEAGAFGYLLRERRAGDLLPHIIRRALGEGEAKAMLRRAERPATRGFLAAGAASDLNDPLSVILGYAEMIASGTAANVRAAAEKIVVAAQRCSRIARSLGAATLSSRLSKEDCPLRRIIEDALSRSFEEVKLEGIEREVDLPPADLHVEADAAALREAFHQIIRNALQATRAPGALRVGWAASGSRVRVWVEDTGPGVPREVAPRIFEPFFTTRGASGLGLTLALSIVREHGGQIWHEEPPGGGARFIMELPG